MAEEALTKLHFRNTSAPAEGDYPFVFLIDDIFQDKSELIDRIPLSGKDKIVFASAEDEPKTKRVNGIAQRRMW